MTQKTFSFALGGGLDLVTPAARIAPGSCIDAKNYEPHDEGGYRRLSGYERYDGQPRPSEASYSILNFDAGTGTAIVVDDVVDGDTSGAAGTVLAVVLESGAWGVDAAGYLVLTEVTGNPFTDNEDLSVSASVKALADGAEVDRGASTTALDVTYLTAAQEARRTLITAVPGSGPVRGVWMHQGFVYAFRDNAGATAGVMHVNSASGWTTVGLGDYLDFSAGTAEFTEGATVTGSPSTATGVIVAVGVTSGSWAGNDAAGRLYIKTITGTFTASDTLADDGAVPGAADCDSAATAVALPVGGKYEFRNYNFGGSASTYNMWGVNGVGRGFRFDGTDFAPIHVTGLTDALDMPEHLHTHQKQLFFSIVASLQHSAIGEPMIWNAVFGASELATGDTITGLRDQPGDIMGVFNRNRTYLLYGNDVANWDLVNFALERGAIEWTIQDLGYSFYLDDRGIQNLSQTDKFGDLKQASISELIDPLIQSKKEIAIDSVRIKSKNQYRLFFSDNTGLILRWDNNKSSGAHSGIGRYRFMPFEYLHKVESIVAEENASGFEEVYFGSDDGFVYQAEKGQSFDGADIEYRLRLAFCHCKSARQKKRFHKATLQIDARDVPDLEFSPEFSYGDPDQAPPGVFNFPEGTLNVGGGVWDANSFWEAFLWDGQLVGEAQAYIDGQGINVSLLVRGASDFERAHTLQSITYNYSMRGLKR